MSENLNRLAYFVAIAEEGTITAAAARLRVSKAVVSKQLQLLEDDLGSTLVLRNSRHFNLTETGETFYEAARAAVAQAKDAFHLVRRGRDDPSGELRVTAPLEFGVGYVAPAVAAFSLLYPALRIDLTLSDTRFDPVEARFDIAFRVGWLEDSRSEEHTSELQSRQYLVCRLLLEKKKNKNTHTHTPNPQTNHAHNHP